MSIVTNGWKPFPEEPRSVEIGRALLRLSILEQNLRLWLPFEKRISGRTFGLAGLASFRSRFRFKRVAYLHFSSTHRWELKTSPEGSQLSLDCNFWTISDKSDTRSTKIYREGS